MRRTLPIFLAASIMLTACAAEKPAEEVPVEVAPSVAPEVITDGLPIDAMPAVARTEQTACPYLDTDWVADTNGQRVTGYGIDERFSTPSCVYYSFPEEPQLTVIVRDMATTDEAIAVVDWAAPIDSTEPAEEPTGWSGGRRGGNNNSGALYAVQKGPTAVIVFTNQDQSLKAQLIAEEVIQNLNL
ncbi:hypothetical protein N24_3040 [Corynebacterium suranareeae]|uniref:DUF2020 domain-containing protein n=1 Tax=Corynebacterium suranareeae TaxID=2506452 RepID=A0A169S931_9CORY|nr:DUF2020 domain-containing protein [Corynebacterium suranareeae]BAU97302.1 hypothetical protein N24_3040 [Corynebacterium suranareeae]